MLWIFFYFVFLESEPDKLIEDSKTATNEEEAPQFQKTSPKSVLKLRPGGKTPRKNVFKQTFEISSREIVDAEEATVNEIKTFQLLNETEEADIINKENGVVEDLSEEIKTSPHRSSKEDSGNKEKNDTGVKLDPVSSNNGKLNSQTEVESIMSTDDDDEVNQASIVTGSDVNERENSLESDDDEIEYEPRLDEENCGEKVSQIESSDDTDCTDNDISDSDEEQICPRCDKVFETKESLEAHVAKRLPYCILKEGKSVICVHILFGKTLLF